MYQYVHRVVGGVCHCILLYVVLHGYAYELTFPATMHPTSESIDVYHPMTDSLIQSSHMISNPHAEQEHKSDEGADGERLNQITPQSDSRSVIAHMSAAYLVDFAVIWPFVICAVTFPLFYAIHPNSRDKVLGYRQIPTISQTGALVPESLFLTYGLHAEAAVLGILFVLLYYLFEAKIRKIEAKLRHSGAREDSTASDWMNITIGQRLSIMCCSCCCCCRPPLTALKDVPYLRYWNSVLVIFGLIAAFLMSLVGSITLNVDSAVHGTVAFIMFFFAILHMVIFYNTIADAMKQTKFQVLLHRLCIFVCIPLNIIGLVFAGLLYMFCKSPVCITCAVDLIPALEFSTTIALVMYVYRFREDFSHVTIASILQNTADTVVSEQSNGGSSDNNREVVAAVGTASALSPEDIETATVDKSAADQCVNQGVVPEESKNQSTVSSRELIDLII